MEPVTNSIVVAAFLGACLYKAGEKVSEKTIETIFENKKELADAFTGLFRTEIIALGLNDSTTTAGEIQQQLNANPEVLKQALLKLKNTPELLKELDAQLRKETGKMIINAEKIGQLINDNHGTINQIVNF